MLEAEVQILTEASLREELAEWRPDLSGLTRREADVFWATVECNIAELTRRASHGDRRYRMDVRAWQVGGKMQLSRETVMGHWRRICEKTEGRLLYRRRRSDGVVVQWPSALAAAAEARAKQEEFQAWKKTMDRQASTAVSLQVDRDYSHEGRYSITLYVRAVESREAVEVLMDRLLESVQGMGMVYSLPAEVGQTLPTLHPAVLPAPDLSGGDGA